jgi:hypothetical protein
MAVRQAKAINARSQVTDVTADPSMGGDPRPAPITFLATEHFPSLSSIPARGSDAVAGARDALGPDEYTRLAAIGQAFSATDLEDYMLRLAEEFP